MASWEDGDPAPTRYLSRCSEIDAFVNVSSDQYVLETDGLNGIRIAGGDV